jgi:hypothetical protein
VFMGTSYENVYALGRRDDGFMTSDTQLVLKASQAQGTFILGHFPS